MTSAHKKTPVRSRRIRPIAHAGSVETSETIQAWWLMEETEICIFCHQGFAFGTEYHCAGCDAVVCAFCVEDRGGEFFCPEC